MAWATSTGRRGGVMGDLILDPYPDEPTVFGVTRGMAAEAMRSIAQARSMRRVRLGERAPKQRLLRAWLRRCWASAGAEQCELL